MQFVSRFRVTYPELVVPGAERMPGADEALRNVRAHGGRTLVVTGKHVPNAEQHLTALDWAVDWLAGDVFAAAKGEVLRAEGTDVYVGDHTGDVEGVRRAGAVAPVTGSCFAEQPHAAGADIVLPDLAAFGRWLDAWCANRAASSGPS